MAAREVRFGKPVSTHRVKPEGMLFRIMLWLTLPLPEADLSQPGGPEAKTG
jgi:hypothetical protein